MDYLDYQKISFHFKFQEKSNPIHKIVLRLYFRENFEC